MSLSLNAIVRLLASGPIESTIPRDQWQELFVTKQILKKGDVEDPLYQQLTESDLMPGLKTTWLVDHSVVSIGEQLLEFFNRLEQYLNQDRLKKTVNEGMIIETLMSKLTDKNKLPQIIQNLDFYIRHYQMTEPRPDIVKKLNFLRSTIVTESKRSHELKANHSVVQHVLNEEQQIELSLPTEYFCDAGMRLSLRLSDMQGECERTVEELKMSTQDYLSHLRKDLMEQLANYSERRYGMSEVIRQYDDPRDTMIKVFAEQDHVLDLTIQKYKIAAEINNHLNQPAWDPLKKIEQIRQTRNQHKAVLSECRDTFFTKVAKAIIFVLACATGVGASWMYDRFYVTKAEKSFFQFDAHMFAKKNKPASQYVPPIIAKSLNSSG